MPIGITRNHSHIIHVCNMGPSNYPNNSNFFTQKRRVWKLYKKHVDCSEENFTPYRLTLTGWFGLWDLGMKSSCANLMLLHFCETSKQFIGSTWKYGALVSFLAPTNLLFSSATISQSQAYWAQLLCVKKAITAFCNITPLSWEFLAQCRAAWQFYKNWLKCLQFQSFTTWTLKASYDLSL